MLVLGPKRLFWRFAFIGILAFDLATGFLIASGTIREGGIFSPSQLGRLIVLLYFLALLLNRKHAALWFIFGVTPFLLIELSFGTAHSQAAGLLYGLITVAKLAVLAAPLLLSFDELDQREIAHSFKVGALAMALVIIASLLLGIGKPTYPSGGFGTKSFFPSGNDIGAYLGSATLLLVVARHYRVINIGMISVALLLAGLIGVSSKASLLFALATLGFLIYHSRARVPAMVGLTVITVLYWSQLIDIAAVVGEIIVRRYHEANGDWLRFLVSGREVYVQEALTNFREHGSVPRLLLGQGIFVGPQSLQHVTMVDFLEADAFDIFFMFGVIGLFAYATLWWRLFSMSQSKRWFTLPIGLLLLHSVLAGHVIFSGLFLQTVLAMTVLLQRDKHNTLEPIRLITHGSVAHYAR